MTKRSAAGYAVSFLLVLQFGQPLALGDVIEFLSGAKISGTVTKIDKTRKKITFRSKLGTRTRTRVYEYSRIHAVTYRGKRYVLNEKSNTGTPSGGGVPTSATGGSVTRVDRSKTEVQKLIDSVGSTPPDWLSSVRLNYPRSLDFSWRDPRQKEWNNSKFIGHYVWDVINPNQSKWREGVKLLHHAVSVSKGNRNAQIKAMNQLGTLYASLLEDWPRAAYWWQQAGKGTPGGKGAGGFRVGIDNGLAKCYWRLGNKDMAVAKMANNRSASPYLWCEMGEYDRGLRQAEQQRKGWAKEGALINCGDVCRKAGWYDKALDYYTRASRLPNNNKYKHTVTLAKKRIVAMRAEQAVDLSRIADGTYRGRSLGYSGSLDVAVSVKGNQITSVKVTKHIEKQYYSSLTDIPNQIVQKQSVKGIDATSSATITAEAIIRAASVALAKGSR